MGAEFDRRSILKTGVGCILVSIAGCGGGGAPEATDEEEPEDEDAGGEPDEGAEEEGSSQNETRQEDNRSDQEDDLAEGEEVSQNETEQEEPNNESEDSEVDESSGAEVEEAETADEDYEVVDAGDCNEYFLEEVGKDQSNAKIFETENSRYEIRLRKPIRAVSTDEEDVLAILTEEGEIAYESEGDFAERAAFVIEDLEEEEIVYDHKILEGNTESAVIDGHLEITLEDVYARTENARDIPAASPMYKADVRFEECYDE